MTLPMLVPCAWRWRGGDEWMLGNDLDSGDHVLVIAPLFEEANSTRRLIADLLRSLGAYGVRATCPDLPGTGESPTPLDHITLDDWRAALADLTASLDGAVHVAAIRGGALLDDAIAARSWWRMAPANGARVMRELRRLHLISGLKNDLQSTDNMIAGYPVSEALLASIEPREPAMVAPLRDFAAPGRIMPWRRAEPASDRALAEAMAADIAGWIAPCAAR